MKCAESINSILNRAVFHIGYCKQVILFKILAFSVFPVFSTKILITPILKFTKAEKVVKERDSVEV